MEIVLWIIFGAVVGWVASLIMSTDSQQGLFLNIAVGIAGAVVGGWIMNYFGESAVTGFNFYSFGVSVGGALILILGVKMIRST